MQRCILSLLFIFGLTTPSFATVVIDDSDLSGVEQHPVEPVSSTLTPSEVRLGPSGETSVRTIIVKGDQEIIVSNPSFKLKKCAKEDILSITAKLENDHFKIKGSWRTYSISAEITCGYQNDLLFTHDSEAGEAMGIWDIGMSAIELFSSINRINFWSDRISIKWPASGDYYSWGTVNITKGYQWDVVAHELGHAIYDQANIGVFGGGSHKIDQCYNEALALSEGWASFFAAWLKIDIADDDAKFEYLVPRRAPIRIEHVPEDVCKGPTNEWRVTSFLWDMIDTNPDLAGEVAAQGFTWIWDIFEGGEFDNIEEMGQAFKNQGVNSELVDLIWALNFE